MESLSPNIDESARLAAIRRYDILDTSPDDGLDRITALATVLFSVPIALISIVDKDRIWFMSRSGLDVPQVPREPGLCASAILRNAPTILGDATTDPEAVTNSLVAGSAALRFYAAAPLQTPDGFNIGTLCVMDTSPGEFPGDRVKALETMAALVMDRLELRLSAGRHPQSEAAVRSSIERVITERTAQLTGLSRELIKATEHERRKLAGELHDDMGGTLTLLSLKLQELGKEIGDGSARGMALQKEAVGMLREIIASQRRIVESLRPMALDMFGLTTAVRNHAADWSKKTGVPSKVHVAPDFPVLDPERALAVYRVVQESLTNVARYARATRVEVSLGVEDDRIRIAIDDDGIGIDQCELVRASAHGLVGMRQRLAAFGGELSVGSGLSGTGASVVGTLPLPQPAAAVALPDDEAATR